MECSSHRASTAQQRCPGGASSKQGRRSSPSTRLFLTCPGASCTGRRGRVQGLQGGRCGRLRWRSGRVLRRRRRRGAKAREDPAAGGGAPADGGAESAVVAIVRRGSRFVVYSADSALPTCCRANIAAAYHGKRNAKHSSCVSSEGCVGAVLGLSHMTTLLRAHVTKPLSVTAAGCLQAGGSSPARTRESWRRKRA